MRPAPTFGDVLAERLGRRDVLRGALASTVLAAAPLAACAPPGRPGTMGQQAVATPRFAFTEISHGVGTDMVVAPGYRGDVLVRWGDPVLPGAPAWDPARQTPEAQEQQFGYNNDYIGFVPLGADRGLLCVNHEYTIAPLMFPGLMGADGRINRAAYTKAMADIELAAHGLTVVEVKREEGRWQVVPNGARNKRYSMLSAVFEPSGPAADSRRLKTAADPTGRRIIGTLNNCAGGITPWGTYLSGEENCDNYFTGKLDGHPEQRNYTRWGVEERSLYGMVAYHSRFNLNAEPNEGNRFGWIVEVDPQDPSWQPKKRTALGRFKHEGAESIVNTDGRVVVYSGDDQMFEFVYRFVSKGRFNPRDRLANRDLLDEGTLSVARFNADGTVTWLPLVHGTGPLTAANGFNSQADVMIECRHAATLLGATPMDRPEDVEPNPKTGSVYVMLTNNRQRTANQADAANPRGSNPFGHIVEMLPPGGDHAADTFRWEILVKCGDPSRPEFGAQWNPATTANGWFASPDNCAVDALGRLWVSTDQGNSWAQTGTSDGLWALETEGTLRGTARMFFRCPVGAELCGPKFTPDLKSLFVAVQHPGADGTRDFAGFNRASRFEDPATRWPDFQPDVPPRPSVVVLTKADGGVIGS
jgi:secreted PhoX family phosphatase